MNTIPELLQSSMSSGRIGTSKRKAGNTTTRNGSNDSGGESDGMHSDSDGVNNPRRRTSRLLDVMTVSSNGRSNTTNTGSGGHVHRFNSTDNANNPFGAYSSARRTSSFRNWRAMEPDDNEDDTGSSSDSSDDGGGSSDTFSLAAQQRSRRRKIAQPKGYLSRNNNGSNANSGLNSGASSDNDQGRPPLVPGSSKNPMSKDPGTPIGSNRWNAQSNLIGPDSTFTSSVPPQPDTPRGLLVSQLRRSSLSSDAATGSSNSGRSLTRIASLMRDESTLFEKEIAHERVTTSLFKRIPPLNLPSTSENELSGGSNEDEGGMMGVVTTNLNGSNALSNSSLNGPTPDSPESTTSAHSMGATQMFLDDYSDLTVPHPVRVSPIPNSQLKSPATYVSNSSRLNPESQFISSKQHQEIITSSPAMSPINAVIGHMSPIALERRNKRKMSVDERFEPYKRHHRVPSSPSGNSNFQRSLSPGAPMLPSPTLSQQLFPPLRARSPSLSMLHPGSNAVSGSNNAPPVMNAMGIMTQGGGPSGNIGAGGTPLSLFNGTSSSTLATLLHGGHANIPGNGNNNMPPPQAMSVPIPFPATTNSMSMILDGSSTNQGNNQTNPQFTVGSPRTYSQSPLAGSIEAAGMNIVNNPPLSPRATAPFGQMLNLSGAQGEFSKMSISTSGN